MVLSGTLQFQAIQSYTCIVLEVTNSVLCLYHCTICMTFIPDHLCSAQKLSSLLFFSCRTAAHMHTHSRTNTLIQSQAWSGHVIRCAIKWNESSILALSPFFALVGFESNGERQLFTLHTFIFRAHTHTRLITHEDTLGEKHCEDKLLWGLGS